MHEPLDELEKQMDKLLGEESPYPMSHSAKKSLAAATWWVCLLIGLLQLWGAWALWQLGHNPTILPDAISRINSTILYSQVTPSLTLTYYLAFFILIADAALLILAAPALKEYRKHGWNLVFYSLLLNVVYSFIRIFSSVGGGFGQFVVQLFVSGVIAYFLFQMRPLFNKQAKTKKD